MSTEIKALMQIKDGTAFEWSLLDIPIPENVLVYVVDEMILKLGNGTDLYDQLPIFFDISKAGDLESFKNKFPELESDNSNKLLVVNSDGTGYQFSSYTIDDLVTLAALDTALDSKADITHSHNYTDIQGLGNVATRNIGNNPGEVPEVLTSGKLDKSIVPIVQEDSLDRDDILTWLVMKQLADDDATKLKLPSGIANEFEDTAGIDTSLSTNSVYNDTHKYYEVTGDGALVSTKKNTTNQLIEVHMFSRIEGDISENVELIAEVSRDNGDTWAHLPLTKSKLSGEQIKVYTGDSTFNEQNASIQLDIADYQIEDYKDDISNFIVDTQNTSGHFDNPISSDVKVGMTINIDKYRLVITDIVGDGSTTDSITFTGTIPTDSYTVDSITTITDGYVGFGNQGMITDKEELPIRINRHTSHMYDEKLYIVGGVSSTGRVDKLVSCNLSDHSFSELADMPATIDRHASVIYNNSLYVIGGHDQTGGLDTIHRYDITDNSWSTFDPLPQVRYNHTAIVHDNKLYVIGGQNVDFYNDLLCYDFVNNNWTNLASLSIGIAEHTATLYQDKIYVIGGNTSDGTINTVYVYDISNDTWEQKTPLPENTKYHDSCLFGDFIYVFGGSNSSYKSTVYRYSILEDMWEIQPSLDISISDHTVELLDNRVYIVGGYLGTDISDEIRFYDIPKLVYGLYTSIEDISHMSYLFDDNEISAIRDILVNQAQSTEDTISYMLRFDDTYSIYSNGSWISVVRNQSDKYQYKENDTWIDAPENTAKSAIKEASKYNFNKMNYLGLSNIPANSYEDIPNELIMVFNGATEKDAILTTTISATKDHTFPLGNELRWRVRVIGDDNEANIHGVALNWN